MKRKLFLAALAVMSMIGVSNAQVFVGPALIYGTNINEPGLQASGYYKIPNIQKLWVGGDISFYMAHKFQPYWKEGMWEINANAHYVFYDKKGLSAYGLGGLNFTTFSFKPYSGYALTYGPNYSSTHLGLNLGVGGTKNMKFGDIFAEIKYVATTYDHLAIGAGVQFPIKTK